MNYLEIIRVVGCFIVIFISRSTNGNPVNFSNLANAYINVASGVFGNKVAKTSNLIISDGKETSLTVSDFKDELLKRTMIGEIRLVFRQDTSSKISVISGRRKRFATFIIESFDDYRGIHKKITTKFFRSHAHIIIVLVNGEILEIDEIFQLLWKLQMNNVVVLYEDNEKVVNAKTFFPFQNGICNCSSSVLINRFVDGRFVNGSEEIFPNKLKNLHNCTINVAISDSSAPAVIVKKLSDGTFDLSGRDIKLIRTLGKCLNFSINFSFIGDEGYFYANGSSKGPLKAVLDGTADLTISDWWMKANRMEYFDESETYIFDTIVFIVPSGLEFTTFEKLAYPFSIGAWLTILAFYAFGFALIFVLELCPDSLRNFVLGRTNNNPHLNMFVGFIGGTQTQRDLPRRNFARYLLMIFLLYSLVIRTAFQGLYYNLLQSSKRHQEVQSLDEIIEKKFELYLFPWILDVFKDTENLRSRVVVASEMEMEAFVDRVATDPFFKGTYELSERSALYHNQINAKEQWLTICKEVFMVMPVVMYAKKKFFLMPEINEQIKRFNANGLIRLWHEDIFDRKKLMATETAYPKALKFHSMIGCFQILALGCLVSLVVFIIEVCHGKVNFSASSRRFDILNRKLNRVETA